MHALHAWTAAGSVRSITVLRAGCTGGKNTALCQNSQVGDQ